MDSYTKAQGQMCLKFPNHEKLTLIFHGLEHCHINDELPRAGTKVLITEVMFLPIYTLYTYPKGNFTQFFKSEFVY